MYVALSGKSDLSGHKVCILSYDLMARKSKELLLKNFNVVIVVSKIEIENVLTLKLLKIP